MRSSKRLFFLLILVVLAVMAGVYILTTPGLKPVVISAYTPPRLVAEVRVQDVGRVETDGRVQTSFILYNKGGQTLRISDVVTSCGCTVAQLTHKVVAPGDFTRLDVVMDTSLKLGAVRKKIEVRSNDPQRPDLTLFLTGEVIPGQMAAAHAPITLKAQDPLALFKGECASCHVNQGKGQTGQALFVADCAMCHGLNGQGHGSAGPSLLNRDYTNAAVVRQMRNIIANGSRWSHQMPPFSKVKGGPLEPDEIDSLVTFLKFQARKNKLGLLDKDTVEEGDEAAFREALRQPH
jgi:mono/diheme cytochrome c family protein